MTARMTEMTNGMTDPLAKIRAGLADGVRVFVVKGAAGTGKTTLIGRLIPELERGRYLVALMAPTGRAAKMIQRRTRREASTIHSVIYEVNDRPKAGTAENGDLRWIFPLKTDRPARTAFIVDEASMVGSALHGDGILQFGTGSLLQDLIDFTGVERPNTDNVVFFVGDPYQLSPVMEQTGAPPALDEQSLGGLTGRTVLSVELTEIHRQQADSGILIEARKLRTSIGVHLFSVFRPEEHSDVHRVNEDDVERRYCPQRDLNDKIIIAYANRRVWEYNRMVRRMLGLASSLPSPGERLLSLRNTFVAGSEGDDVRFMNGDMLLVLEADTEHLVRLDGFYRPNGREETLHYEFVFCKMKVGWLYEGGDADAEIWVNVTPLTSDAYREEPEFASLALYVAVVNNIRKLYGLKDNRNDNVRLDEYLKKSRLYHAPWVTYGYAVTGHKSQGGEWREVWVDYEYAQNRMTEAYFRWLYTVTTRARQELVMIAPPQIDDLIAALDRHLADCGRESPVVETPTSALTLKELLARQGYSLGATIRRPFAFRLELVRPSDPLAEVGTLDLNYNGNDVVTYVRLDCFGADDALGEAMSALKGRSIKTLMPDGRSVPMRIDPSSVVGGHARLRDRLLAAAEKSGLTVVSVRSLTPNQLRLELSSTLGEGYVDFYVDGKGRVSEMGSMTVGATSLYKLREGLKA